MCVKTCVYMCMYICGDIKIDFFFFPPFLAAVLQMSGRWCVLAPVVQDQLWPGRDVGLV